MEARHRATNKRTDQMTRTNHNNPPTTAKALKALRVFILREYGKALGLMRIDACELVDLVAWEKMTECQLIAHLDAQVRA